MGTEAEKNEIWTAIKTIPTWQKDIVADIQVTGGPAAGAGAPTAAAAPSAVKTYTVKAGDTLGAIAKEHLGSAGAYMKIFELNKDPQGHVTEMRALANRETVAAKKVE